MNYIKVCEFPDYPRHCSYVAVEDFLEMGNMASASSVLNEEVMTHSDFWMLVTMVAVTWAIAHLIRQLLNLVNWRR